MRRRVLVVLTLVACGSAEAPLGREPVGSSNAGVVTPAPDPVPSTPPSTTDAGVVDAAPLTCSGRAQQPLDAVWSMSFGGRERTAAVHVPALVRPDVAASVVLNFHGFTSNAAEQAALSKMNDKADQEGFVVVYPEGLDASWNAGACCGESEATEIDDVGFVGALLDELERRLCVDTRRVFATGMSNGGFLSHKLACTLSDRIAAVAPVAGVLGEPTCTPSRPVPVLHTHGTLDTLVPYIGDVVKGFPSVRATLDGWASRNGCEPTAVEFYRNREAHCEAYPKCAAGSEVVLCVVDGGGHTWPGGMHVPALGYTSISLDATDRIWRFFQKHPLP